LPGHACNGLQDGGGRAFHLFGSIFHFQKHVKVSLGFAITSLRWQLSDVFYCGTLNETAMRRNRCLLKI
jgi:predicted phosphatase